MNIIIVGSGAVAAELTSYIKDHNRHVDPDGRLNILGYLESEENIPKYWAKYKLERPVVGSVDSYRIMEDDRFIVGISNIPFREKMMAALKAKGGKVVGFTHCSSIVADSAVIGSGNIIYPNCIIGPNAVIGNNNLVTAYSFISHDCIVGDSNFMATAGLSGHVTIGHNNYFGIRATVLPNVSIGNNNTIQAGMVVEKDIADDTVVFHRFKEKVFAIKSASEDE